MTAAARILDANANRAREALRVLEDAARFALDDAALSAELKSIRHGLREALELLPPGWLEAGRDAAGDVGTSISTPGESRRAGLPDVVTAAGRRLGEALRVIEETGKIVDVKLARRAEALRYRAYDAETALLLRLGSGRARQWRVCVLLTEAACVLPWHDVLRAVVDGGADCIQVREKREEAGALARRVEGVLAVARPAGTAVIVDDRVDVALVAGADGVHLGGEDLAVPDARRLAGRTLLVGASTHDLDEAAGAVEAGADYCGVGTIFASTTKARPPAGLAYLRAFRERHPDVPHLAIGGITPGNAGRVAESGGRGVAVCAAVCGAKRPDRVVEALRDVFCHDAPARPRR